MTPQWQRDSTTADHARIEALFVELVSAVEECRDGDARSTRLELVTSLDAHLYDEDTRILPLMLEILPREARALLAEHRYFQARLESLGADWEAPLPRAGAVHAFSDEFSAHARSEEAVYERWAQGRRKAV